MFLKRAADVPLQATKMGERCGPYMLPMLEAWLDVWA